MEEYKTNKEIDKRIKQLQKRALKIINECNLLKEDLLPKITFYSSYVCSFDGNECCFIQESREKADLVAQQFALNENVKSYYFVTVKYTPTVL